MKKLIFITLLFFVAFGCSNATNNDVNESTSNGITENVNEVNEDDEVFEDVNNNDYLEVDEVDEIGNESVKNELSDELSSDKYLEIINSVYDLYNADMTLLLSNLKQVEADDSLYSEELWTDKVKDSLMRLQSTYELLKGMSDKGLIPSEYDDFHEDLKKPFFTMGVMNELYHNEFIDQADFISYYMETMEESVSEMMFANKRLEEVLANR